MLKLFLIRHGETNENIAGITQGQSCGTLSDKGRRQVSLLAERLKNEKFDLILSSDLPRAIETTKAISKYHDCPVEYRSELRERSSGIFEGRKYSEYEAEYIKGIENFAQNPEEFKPENGESLSEVYSRVVECLTTVIALPRPKSILISAHGGSIGCALCYFLKKPVSEFRSISQSNTCVNQIFLAEDDEISHINLNCTSHLTD